MERINRMAASRGACLRDLGPISRLQRVARWRVVSIRFPDRRRLAVSGDVGDEGWAQDVKWPARDRVVSSLLHDQIASKKPQAQGQWARAPSLSALPRTGAADQDLARR